MGSGNDSKPGSTTAAQLIKHEMGTLLHIYATRNVNKLFSKAFWNPKYLKKDRALGIIANIFDPATGDTGMSGKATPSPASPTSQSAASPPRATRSSALSRR